METIQLILVFVIWCLVAVGLGWIEGNWFHNKYYPKNPNKPYLRYDNKYDKHIYLTIIRACICAMAFVFIIPLFLPVTWISILLFGAYTISYMLVFPFFHDGQLYKTWNKLNPTVFIGGWKAYDDTPTSKFNFTYKQRLYMLIISLTLLLISILI